MSPILVELIVLAFGVGLFYSSRSPNVSIATHRDNRYHWAGVRFSASPVR